LSVLAERLAAQLLAGEPGSQPEQVARHLLAVQAQDRRGMCLAVRGRVAAPDLGALHAALGEHRTLVVSWLCRGTLQLVAAEDFGWLHALTTPPLHAGSARRLAQEGVPPAQADRAVAEVERALASDGPQTRWQLSERVGRLGIRVDGQALVHILFLAALRGVAVRGPVIGAQHAYGLARDWLAPDALRPAADRDRALAELARRYLRGHGPASERDLARWAGLPLRDARVGLSAIAGELDHRPDGNVALRDARPAGELPAPKLLGPWDPLLVGWRDRTFVAGGHEARLISGGLFRPFALVGGRAVATWGIRSGKVDLDEPFLAVAEPDREALEADARAVAGYFDLAGSDRA
jgi:hypothetical protein